MPSIYDAFPSNYLRAADLQGRPLRLVIESVVFETLGQGKDAQTKPVCYFAGQDKGLALNKTNAEMIASQYGHETDNWPGAEVELYQVTTEYGGKPVEAIRVRFPPRQVQRPADNPAMAQRRAAPARQAQQPVQHYDERNPPPPDDL